METITFWHGFFWKFKRWWDEKMEAIKTEQTEFGLELAVLEANVPDLRRRQTNTARVLPGLGALLSGDDL